MTDMFLLALIRPGSLFLGLQVDISSLSAKAAVAERGPRYRLITLNHQQDEREVEMMETYSIYTYNRAWNIFEVWL